jgi:hypothetical protein
MGVDFDFHSCSLPPNILVMTKACGNVIAAKKEKNRALNNCSCLNTKKRTEIPKIDIPQYNNADLQ